MQGWALSGLVVAEIGERIAVGSCGTLLADAGADVIMIEPPADHRPDRNKWRHRAEMAAGKQSIVLDAGRAGDAEALRAIVAKADVVLLSSDIAGEWSRGATGPFAPHQIVCDITAFGGTGPHAGEPWPDVLIQALSGVCDVTGQADQPPSPVGLPVLEMSAAVYAAAGIVAARLEQQASALGQRLTVALYDCGVNSLATFLPLHFGGRAAARAGNRHSMAAPWNAYRAADGWLLLCSATDDQWRRLCASMERTELAAAPGFTTLNERMGNIDRVDAEVAAWVGRRSVEECIRRLGESGIVCGPIVPVAGLKGEPNMVARQSCLTLRDEERQRTVEIAASPMAQTPGLGRRASAIPVPDEQRKQILAKLQTRAAVTQPANTTSGTRRPLDGIRVLEIGQYTTAPLAARHLATLGANVIKIEPPSGEASRVWPPIQGGQGFFFTMSNSDKQSVVLDLDTAPGREQFARLLESADVLVENTKPGSLKRRGFGPDELAKLNPRLVYCAISGFGYTTAYPLRPAMDTVVQAMSGIMDLTRSGGVPVKAGISAGDIIGGQFALLAILLALHRRSETGSGAFIDLAMQDAGAWCTRLAWNGTTMQADATIIPARDGYVAVSADGDEVGRALAGRDSRSLVRRELCAWLAESHIAAAPVQSVAEVAEDPQTSARGLVIWRKEGDYRWPLLGSPIGLSRTPPTVGEPIGPLGSGNAKLAQITTPRRS